jgi:hypothetical protein
MNWDEIRNDWRDMTTLVRTHWPLLTEEDCLLIDGDRSKLLVVLQQRYKLSEVEADGRVCSFEYEVRRPGAVK